MNVSRPLAVAWLALLGACATTGKQPPPAATPAPAPAAPPAAEAQSPFEAAARPIFGGCEPSGEGGSGRAYSCGKVDAWIINMGELELEQAMAIGLASAKEAMAENMHSEQVKLKLAGQDWDALRVSNCPEAGEGCESGFMVAVKGPQDITRFIGCAVKGHPPPQDQQARCQKMLDYFATHGTPDGVALRSIQEEMEQPPPTLLSRPLVVPDGCRVEESSAEGGLIDCPQSMFSWAVVDLDEEFKNGLEMFSREMKQRLPTVTSEKRMSCTVERKPAECAILEGTSQDGSAIRVYVGQAVLPEGKGLLTTCFFTEAQRGFAPVCNDVFVIPQ
ncbi:MAG TPA: hypothetical protein VK447_12745 [Myxococcaceae bacterium]|nr:hypothetical protein [Myxococcaceae bacterium]